MNNNEDFIEFVKQGDYSQEKIDEIKDSLSLNDSQLIKKTFKLLNSEIGVLDENLFYLDTITNCTNLLAVICNENNFEEGTILVNRKRIKKSREALLALSNKYHNEELLQAANKLDEIILDKSIDLNDLIRLIKVLIDRKEDFNIIKKLLNTNKGVLLQDNNELFDYTFKKAVKTLESIEEDTPDIYYYISLLKIFYSSKVDKTEYIKEINDKFNESNEFSNEIYCILQGHRRELTQNQILSKYGIIRNLQTINIVTPDKTTKDDFAFTMDTEGTNIRDDAISVRKDGNNTIVGIHIADPASFIEPGSIVDYQALNNYSCTYLEGTSTRMLPNNIEHSLSLDKGNYRKVFSLYVVFRNNGSIADYYLIENVIKISENLSFSEADQILSNSTTELAKRLHELYEVSSKLEINNLDKYLYWDLKENDSMVRRQTDYKTNLIINEMMVLYGHLLATIACNNNIPYNYRTQSIAYLQKLVDKMGIKLDDESRRVINSVYLRSKYSIYPMYHNGLKLNMYSHSTRPLGRYPDLHNEFLMHYFFFKDIKYDYDSQQHEFLVEYYNQRSSELSLMRSEYSRALKKED